MGSIPQQNRTVNRARRWAIETRAVYLVAWKLTPTAPIQTRTFDDPGIARAFLNRTVSRTCGPARMFRRRVDLGAWRGVSAWAARGFGPDSSPDDLSRLTEEVTGRARRRNARLGLVAPAARKNVDA